jgi:hypothetical protein
VSPVASPLFAASFNDLETAVVQKVQGDYLGMMFILVTSTTLVVKGR